MKDGNAFWRAVRISWPVLGGLWGAWIGFGGYLGVAPNADSFAMLLAMGFYVVFAVAGLLAGIAIGGLTGGIAEWLLRRVGVGIAGALIVATVVNALVLWQVAGFVQAKYPGLNAPAAKLAVSSTIKSSPANPCAHQKIEKVPRAGACSS
ncbi:MAG: hypothetical protein Q8N04_13215 [Nitrospira sp.]|nr:hypothetical protein [Nitrospira sp.]